MTKKPRAGSGGWVKRLITRAALFVIAASLLATLPFRWVSPPTSAFMLQAKFGGLGGQPACASVTREWVAWEDIAPDVPLAVVAAEDQLFPTHWGLDLNAIGSVLRNMPEGGPVRGASTITQQLIKNLYLWPGQSWIRKGMEAWLTLVLEATWPKRRILEVYLNTVQFGGCIFGVQAAAGQFFAKPASRLSAREAALLASVLPNPVRFDLSRPTDYMRKREQWILQQMRSLGGLDYLAQL